MNLLLNFSTLKKGGGLNVSMNFLYAHKNVECPFNIYFMVAEGSPQYSYLKSIGCSNVLVAPSQPVARILWEAFSAPKWLRANKIDLVYSYFGYAFFPKRFRQVTGSADSNLYFPEVDFWEGHKGIQRLKKSIIDFYRLFCVKRAVGVVFENAAMLDRAKKLFGLEKVVFIKPSIKLLAEGNSDCNFQFGEGVVALFLCDWHTNKNVKIIPDLLLEAKKANFDLKIVMSAKFDDSPISIEVKHRLIELGLMERFFALGAVPKENLSTLYSAVDAVMLLSKLESFSNNIIEAWSYQKPLVVADEEWSKAICGNAAFYVPRNNAKVIVDCLRDLRDNRELVPNYIIAAQNELNSYPTIEERIKLEYEFLQGVVR